MSFRHSVTNRAAEKAALIIYIFGRMVLRLRSAVTFLAGMYRIEEADGMKIPHFILLTKEAPKDIHFIHSRMPLVLDINDSNMINGWINPGSGPWILERIIRNTVTDMVFEKRNVG